MKKLIQKCRLITHLNYQKISGKPGNVIILLVMLLFAGSSTQHLYAQCCLTNQLIINTGYDPVSNLAVPAGISCSTGVQDPHWQVTMMDAGLTSDISSTTSPCSTYVPVAAPAPADVINPAFGWAPFPTSVAGGPGNWINCFNGSGYTQKGKCNYKWAVSRSFYLECAAQVTFNFSNVTIDNWCTGGSVSGVGGGPMPIPLTYYSGGGMCAPYNYFFGGNPAAFYTVPPFIMNLGPGLHTITFNLLNDNAPVNNIGFCLQGTITTPSASIMPENCVTNQLIINTGYNNITGLAVTPGTNGGTPVPDPNWNVTYMDANLTSDILSSPAITGNIPVTPTAPADVINPAWGWAAYPGGPGGPGNWINSFNGSGYIQTTPYNYAWTATRTFNLATAAWVTFNFTNVTSDNWITGGNIDGSIAIPITTPPYSGPGAYAPPIYVFGGNPAVFYTSIPVFMQYLSAGPHTISFNLLNDNPSANNIGFALQGFLTAQPEALLSNNPTVCPIPVAGPCVGSSVTITPPLGGGTWSSSNPGVASVDGLGNVYGISSGTATITYAMPPTTGCNVLYSVTVNAEPVITCSVISIPTYPYWQYSITETGATDTVNVCYCLELFDPTTGDYTIWCTTTPGFTGTYIVPLPANGYYGTSHWYAFPPCFVENMNVNCVSEDGCTWQTQCYSSSSRQTPSGIGKTHIAGGDITVLPNPNSGTFSIKGTIANGKTASQASIEVLDMLGKTVVSDVATITNGNIDKTITLGENIANGVYMVRIKTGDASQVIRVSIDR